MPTWSLAMFWENIFKNSTLASAFNQVGLEAVTEYVCQNGWFMVFFLCQCVWYYPPFAYLYWRSIKKYGRKFRRSRHHFEGI